MGQQPRVTTQQPGLPFALGHISIIPGGIDALTIVDGDALTFPRRHLCGDWGALGGEDRQAQAAALINGTRIFSAYYTTAGVRA